MLVKAVPAINFTDSVGVNTHLNYPQYSSITRVINCLNYLGVRHARDLIFAQNAGTYVPLFQQVMNTGVKFCMMSTTDLGSLNEQVDLFASTLASGMSYVEGSNEDDISEHHRYNGNPAVRQNGVDGDGFPVGTRLWQRHLYARVKTKTSLASIPVVGPSVARAASYATLGNLADASDYGNSHSYFSNGDNPGLWREENKADVQVIAPGRPMVATEGGYHTATGVTSGNLGLTPAIHAKYTPRFLMEQFQHGWTRTYLYELINKPNENLNEREDNWGLFYSDGSAKPAATAVGAMMTILKDTGAPLNHATGSLDFSVTGMPSSGNWYVFQKQNGVFYIVLWNEVRNWTVGSGGFNVADVPITLTVNLALKAARSYKPTVSGTTATNLNQASTTFSLGLPDSLLIVELEPSGSTTEPEPDPNPQPSAAATVRRKSEILALLADNTSGAISGQDVRDTIETLYARSWSFSVREYGAIADGSSHPLSQRYGSLAAAQVDYPFAVSLDDETDWAATQAAFNAAASAYGGTVYSPGGHYRLNRTLTLPNAPLGSAEQKQKAIVWQGDCDNTRYQWTAAAPNAVTLISHAGDNTEFAHHALQDISFIGPGIASGTTGVWLAEGMVMRRCFLRDFGRAVSINGGPKLMERTWFGRNGVDVYYRAANSAYASGTLFERCLFSQWQAGDGCILVSPSNTLSGAFEACSFGNTGYVFAKEAGAGNNLLLRSVYMMHCRAEGVGNSFMIDLNSPAVASIRAVHIVSTVLRAGTARTGIRSDALFDLGAIEGLRITQPGSVDEWPARGQAMFKVTGKVTGVHLEGSNRFASTATTAGKQFFIGTHISMLGGAVLEGDSMSGTLMPVTTGSIARGQAVAFGSGSATPAGTGTKVIGVAANAAATGSAVYVITRGQASVQCTGTIASGAWVRISSNGVVQTASNRTDGTVVGCAVAGSSGGFVTIMVEP